MKLVAEIQAATAVLVSDLVLETSNSQPTTDGTVQVDMPTQSAKVKRSATTEGEYPTAMPGASVAVFEVPKGVLFFAPEVDALAVPGSSIPAAVQRRLALALAPIGTEHLLPSRSSSVAAL